GIRVSLSSPDRRVVDGSITGLLVAVNLVQIIIGSFLMGVHQEQKSRQNPKLDNTAIIIPTNVAVPFSVPDSLAVLIPLQTPTPASARAPETNESYSAKQNLTSPTFRGDNWSSYNAHESRNKPTDINVVSKETVVTTVDPTSEAGMWLYAGNIPRTTYNDELQKVFEEHGSIEKVEFLLLNGRGFPPYCTERGFAVMFLLKFIVSIGGLHTLTAHDMCRWDFHQGKHMMIGLGRAAGLLRADTLPIDNSGQCESAAWNARARCSTDCTGVANGVGVYGKWHGKET
ncbi:AT-hook motif nuclear-localized protein 1-like protein, partial [Tanacetum coccineum]